MFRKYENLIIKCNDIINEEIFELFCEKVINSFNYIDNWLNVKYDELSLTLVSKHEMDLIVKEKSLQYKNMDVPDWLDGFSNFEEAWVVIPKVENFNETCKVALHELTHLVSYKLDTSQKRIKLLDEGIAVFLSNQYEGKRYTPWVNAYLKNELPKVSDFCTYDGIEFSKRRRIQILLPYNRIFNKYLW